VILHLVPEAAWRALAPGEVYAPASLADEGFVHCTAGDDLLLRVANAFYRDEPDALLVLDIDEAQLTSEVRWEAPPGGGPMGTAVLFPHVYGPIDTAAVVGIRRALRDDLGAFTGIGRYEAI
jgi:uncharacterized protein (DUF952 family)